MRGFDVLAEAMRRRGSYPSNSYSHVQVGEISSYNPKKHTVKVLIQPDGVESPWMPLGAMAVGMGCGIMVAPNIGDIVLVDFVGGDFASPVVVARFFSLERPPAELQPGEVLIQQSTGTFFKLGADGTITSSAPIWNHTGDINVTGTVTATTDVIGGGKSLKNHTHGGVRSGGDTSGPPS